MKRISAFLIALTLSLSMAVAQERKPFLVRAVNKLGAFIDTMATTSTCLNDPGSWC